MTRQGKCALCKDIVIIKNNRDIFSCSCGEVQLDTVFGEFHAYVKNKENLIIVDDQGNPITSKEALETVEMPSGKPTKQELLDMLSEMIKNIDNLPSHAAHAPVTHSDFSSVLSLLLGILRSV